jgi:hypothetical protein
MIIVKALRLGVASYAAQADWYMVQLMRAAPTQPQLRAAMLE